MSERLKLILAGLIFVVFVSIQIWALGVGALPPTGKTFGMVLLGLGFVVMTGGMMVKNRCQSTADRTKPELLRLPKLTYAGLTLGLTMWAAAPLVMRLDGVEWSEMLGSGRWALSLGWLTAIVWGAVALSAVTFVTVWVRNRPSK